MTNKSLKHALVSSIMAMLLCVAMLAGTTFAWFTDSVTSARNTICSGNLDIELYYGTVNAAGDAIEKWTKVDNSTKLFDENALWEPGYTETVYLQVANVGELALKYDIALAIYEVLLGKTADGKDIDLTKYIKADMLVSDTEIVYANRAAARAAATSAENIKDFALQGNLKSGEAKFVNIVAFMPETVGNEANHNGKNIPSITLGVNVLATQDTVEKDSFDELYDKDAAIEKAPVAKVTKLPENSVPTIDIYDYSGSVTGEKVDLDVAYDFVPVETGDEADENRVRNYHADFVVSFNQDVAADTVILAGNRGDMPQLGWVAFKLPALNEGEEYRLLKTAMGDAFSINYWELCQLVKTFKCGAASDVSGLKMTVKLCLFETDPPSAENGNSTNVETVDGEVITVGEYVFEVE